MLHVPRDARAVADRPPARGLAALPGRRGRTRTSRPTAPRRRSTRSRRYTIGGTADGRATPRRSTDEILGISDGVPGQRFALQRHPVVPGDEPRVARRSAATTAGRSGRRSRTSPTRGRTTQHFLLDAVAGEVEFGPAVRQADGTLRQYGAVPLEGRRAADAGVPHRRRPARQRGPRRAPDPAHVDPVRRPGREPAPRRGGVDAEDIEDAKVRGPILLRTRQPGGDGRGLRDARARGRARGRARALRSPRATGPRPAPCACWSSRRRRPTDGRLRFEQLIPSDEAVGADRLLPRRASYDRCAGRRGAAVVPGRDDHGAAARAAADGSDAPPGTRSRRSTATSTRHRRARRQGLAVRAAGSRGRGLLRPPGPPRHRARRGGEALRGRPDDRPARQGGRADRARQARARLLVRAPGQGRG